MFSYTNSRGITYHLNTSETTLKNGQKSQIFYFTKDVRSTATSMPVGYEIGGENIRSGLPYLKKVK